MAPTPGGSIDQVTVFAALITVAANCFVCPAIRLAVTGATLTETGGIRVTIADADLVWSAWPVADIVTFFCGLMPAGAVDNPLAVIVPGPPVPPDQITADRLVLWTVVTSRSGR